MLKILIVEDNKIALMQAKNMFKMIADTDVHIASCGEDALTICREIAFDIISMDIGLGEGIDGIETSKRIRDIELELGHKSAYIFALTAHSMEPDDIKYHQSMGIDKSYNKPARKEIINEVLSLVADK